MLFRSKGETKSVAPAKVEALPKESDLASITLTEEADSRLGIELANPVAMKQLRKRTFGGEVLLPPGKVIQVPAPVGGKLIDAKGIPFPASGMKVRSGQVLLTLSPLLSPERDVPTPAEQVQMVGARATLVAAQVTAQGDMDRSNADLAAARINLDRAQKLFADRVASQRAVDDATAAYKVADANFLAAKQRKEQLTLLIQSLDRPPQETQRAESIPIHAPWDGIIRNVLVSSSQQVVGGSPLFEIIDTSSVWLRVPVFVDLLPSLAIDREARVVRLDGKPLIDPKIGRAHV